MIAKVPSASLFGVDGQPVSVEVHVSNGLPGFTIVGLPDAACRESRDRVRAAFLSSGLLWRIRRATINLAPTSVKKGGAALDLSIAVGLLVAIGEVPEGSIANAAFLGELGLDGSIRAVDGMLSLIDAIDAPTVIVPPDNVDEARLVGRHDVKSARNLSEVLSVLRGKSSWYEPLARREPPPVVAHPDMADVRGQVVGRWALEIAAAGGHNALLIGPPGSGKSMLARRLAGVLPPLSKEEALQTTRIHSVAGLLPPGSSLITEPPMRSPHHTATPVAILGGGSQFIRPGEVSLATNGVLFLDEFGEFSPITLEALRQPLEDGCIRIARAVGTVCFPAQFQLVAAMNPCPCGEGAMSGRCRCTEVGRARYARRLSGPIFDRFDIRVTIDRPDPVQLLDSRLGESSADIRERIISVRQRARQRGVRCNAELNRSQLDEYARLSDSAQRLVQWKLEHGDLSARGLQRIRRLARTIADLEDDVEVLSDAHVSSALELRAEAEFLEVA